MDDFKSLQKKYDHYWKEKDLLGKLQKKNKGGKGYFYLDGPPYANFVPHVGHIRNTVYKDLGIRLAFMKGYNVLFQPGFDTHGLPVENMVEKKLKLHSKKSIEKIGVGHFTKTCREWATTNKDLWLEAYKLLGSWYAWKEPYLTYNNDYLESGWWSFKQMWNKKLVYEGQKPVFWCPKCETALSGYEVTDSYIMKSDPSIIIKFKLKNKDDYLLVFTTTPWTLISNTAIVAKADEMYVKVETVLGNLILAKKRLDILADLGIGFKVIEEFEGKKLDSMKYEPILDVPMQRELGKNKTSHRIYMSIPILKERVPSKVAAKKNVGESGDIYEHFVSVEEGTGLVHTAPGHGKTDNEIGVHYKLEEASPLDSSCNFTDMAGQFKGMFVKDADKDILKLLESGGKLVYHATAEHKYPVCWRCKAPLIFRMSNQWFVKIDRDAMVKLNEKVRWLPGYAGERFESWVLNAEDWNISRQRYWGIPIPVWKCECGKSEIVSSFAELKKKSIEKLNDNFDLHNASKVKIRCSCGKEMERIKDIFDV
jgi:isoleucyl-tRNA synthetase